MTRTNTPILVACAIIEKDGMVLAAQRGRGRSHVGSWEFPGGKVRENESAEEAVVREIREELGASISVMKMLDKVTYSYPDKTVTLIPFVCRPVSGSFSAKEHMDIRWVDAAEAQGLAWLPPDREILEAYLLIR
jgi:8-oxo-dGTP diphosphatase